MSASAAVLQGFAYGEHLQGIPQRSLGFGLLAPVEPQDWCAEVEGLARRLQAAPYPDTWPSSELFCSVLLADGRRLIALARYGLVDHTPSRRRGGLELIGVIGPGSLGVHSALAVYQWLRQRRAQTDDQRSLGGSHALAEVLATVPPVASSTSPVPVLPIRLWQEGVLLFAATGPSDPNERLGLLEQGAAGAWQWLPLVGQDFPFQTYAQRGPLIAWTPHLAGVAVKLDRPAIRGPARLTGSLRIAFLALIAFLLVLSGANLWATFGIYRTLQTLPQLGPATNAQTEVRPPAVASQADHSGERFTHALYRLLRKPGAATEWSTEEVVRQYERLVAEDPDLRQAGPEGKEVAVAVSVLSRRHATRIEQAIRMALKGYDPRLVNLACQQVREQLVAEPGK
jgi:hypothetical protein